RVRHCACHSCERVEPASRRPCPRRAGCRSDAVWGARPRMYMLDLATGVGRRVDSFFVVGEVWTGLAIGDGPRDITTTAPTSSSSPASVGQSVTFPATVLTP